MAARKQEYNDPGQGALFAEEVSRTGVDPHHATTSVSYDLNPVMPDPIQPEDGPSTNIAERDRNLSELIDDYATASRNLGGLAMAAQTEPMSRDIKKRYGNHTEEIVDLAIDKALTGINDGRITKKIRELGNFDKLVSSGLMTPDQAEKEVAAMRRQFNARFGVFDDFGDKLRNQPNREAMRKVIAKRQKFYTKNNAK